MKNKTSLLALVHLLFFSCLLAQGQGTAFTYQGRLNNGANPAAGSYDLRFALYDALGGGTQEGGMLTNSATDVSNGLFTVILDFGNQFPGADRWLEIAVRTNGDSSFELLAPRQALTATPYASYAHAANALTTSGNQPLGFSINGTNVLRITTGFDSIFSSITVNSVGGYSGNVISNGFVGGFIGGGGNSLLPNRVGADYASVLGGYGNTASGYASTALGAFCTASGAEATAIGDGATASGTDAIAMGWHATASGSWSLALGDHSTASGDWSTALGHNATASAEHSTAMGYRAKANMQGSFVWSDSQDADFTSTEPNQFSIRAAGGVRVASGGLAVTGSTSPHYGGTKGVYLESIGGVGYIYAYDYVASGPINLALNSPGGNVGIGTATPAYKLQVAGNCAATSFVTTSDRNAKENFQPVDASEVLAKVVALPVSRWNFKEDKSSRHVGPMAQDFYAAFGTGVDDKHIATVDADGVALAAIQGLNQKLEQKETEITDLKRRLEILEQLIHQPK